MGTQSEAQVSSPPKLPDWAAGALRAWRDAVGLCEHLLADRGPRPRFLLARSPSTLLCDECLFAAEAEVGGIVPAGNCAGCGRNDLQLLPVVHSRRDLSFLGWVCGPCRELDAG